MTIGVKPRSHISFQMQGSCDALRTEWAHTHIALLCLQNYGWEILPCFRKWRWIGARKLSLFFMKALSSGYRRCRRVCNWRGHMAAQGFSRLTPLYFWDFRAYVFAFDSTDQPNGNGSYTYFCSRTIGFETWTRNWFQLPIFIVVFLCIWGQILNVTTVLSSLLYDHVVQCCIGKHNKR
jgi:hypothetical protein